MSVIGSNVLAGASGGGAAAGYEITRSLRFNSADSAYLNRTPSSAGNRKTWTWSGWVKRSELGSYQAIFTADASSGTSANGIWWADDDSLYFFFGGNSLSTAVFRDLSAWYHIVCSLDTTQGTDTDRFKVWINNQQITQWASVTWPSSNTDYGINNSVEHDIGRKFNGSNPSNFYLADVHFIDGQALDPTDFGEFDDNNVWQPKEFTPPATPNDGTTWSSNSTGVANDGTSAPANAFDGNLDTTAYTSGGANSELYFDIPNLTVNSTVRVHIAQHAETNVSFYVIDTDDVKYEYLTAAPYAKKWVEITGVAGKTIKRIGAQRNSNGHGSSHYAWEIDGVTLIDGDTSNIGVNGFHLPFSDNSSNAALGTDSSGNNNTWTVNNLVATAPGLETANQGFDVVTYTGNGSTQTISGLAFQPDFVWAKKRNGTTYHNLVDSVRGANKELYSNDTLAETTPVTAGLTAFNSDGFTLGANGGWNNNNDTYVAWCWKAGGTAVSNTDGTITSSVSANTTYGFSIVSYTSTGGSATVGHGLGAAPSMVITKGRNVVSAFITQHISLATDNVLYLNGNDATQDVSGNGSLPKPASTVFSVNNQTGSNGGTHNMIAYCWSEVSGFSKFGSYVGTGVSSGNVITVGFKPRFVLIKNTSSTANWRIYDTARGNDKVVNPNTSGAEFTTGDPLNFTNTSFEPTGTTNEDTNKSGDTYIYAAFAGTPPGEIIDSLVDSPTNGTQTDTGAGGEVVGNYAIWNPLEQQSQATLANGNLDVSFTSNAGHAVKSTFALTSGKWYWEVTVGGNAAVGIQQTSYAVYQWPGTTSYSYGYVPDGRKVNNLSYSSYGSAFSNGDIVGIAFDADNGKLWFLLNGTWQNSGDPAAGTNAAFSSLTTGIGWSPSIGYWSSTTGTVNSTNFGQRAFAYTAPSGFKALCTTNFDDPTIADGSDYFDVVTYTGDGNSTRTISNIGFSPDLVWTKARNQAYGQNWYDIVRTAGKVLRSDLTDAEATNHEHGYLSAFNSDGYTMSSGTTSSKNGNELNTTYVGWAWDAGSSTVSNTDGSITSSVRANASAGFSIVTYTGDGTSGAGSSVGHGLGVAPAMVVTKMRAQNSGGSSTSNWLVYHKDLNGNVSGDRPWTLYLNETAAQADTEGWGDYGGFTSSVFTVSDVSSFNAHNNNSTSTYVAYCFAPVEGYSAFGSYTGNGSADGPFVFTGFRPKFVIIKYSSASGTDWLMYDSERDTYNVVDATLYPNSSTAENNVVALDFTSNGFKIRASTTRINASSGTFIYAAFAEHPFKTARAR